MSATTPPTLSVVVPVYNEEGNAAPLFREIRDVMTAIGQPFEVIFVNDGSTDRTLDHLRAAISAEPRLRVVDLDGNFGEAAALCAGFQAARGGIVITLDGDGQNDPRDIPRLLETLQSNGYRCVSGWRQQRQEGFLLRVLPSRLANGLIAAVTRLPVHDNGCGLKVYRRDVVEGAALPRGMNRFMPAIFGVTADEVAEVPVSDRRRQSGTSHYGIGRTVIVLRDLLALRFIIAGRRRAEAIWIAVAIAAVFVHAYGHWHHTPWLTLPSALIGTVALLICWNLRRFKRAQRAGVFRVRREYSAVTSNRGD